MFTGKVPGSQGKCGGQKLLLTSLMMTAALLTMTGCSGEKTAQNVRPSAQLMELEEGLTAVEVDGDYHLDQFLSEGGASSDKELIAFLQKTFAPDSAQAVPVQGDAFACSTISVKGTKGQQLFGRNFDWRKCNGRILVTHPDKGYASVSTVNMDFLTNSFGFGKLRLSDETLSLMAVYAPVDGMNEKGLAISSNTISIKESTDQQTDLPDITTSTATRLILDQASSVSEALDLLKSYDMHASLNFMIHYAITDASGRSVAVEYSGDQMLVTNTPILTNFYVAKGDQYGIGTKQSRERYVLLQQALLEKDKMTPEEVADTLDLVSKDNFPESGESTEWSIVYDQTNLTATYYHREDYSKRYLISLK